MKYNQYQIKAPVWLYTGYAAWHFVTIPQDISNDIKKLFGDRARGWGSLLVEITIKDTKWKTSIFPDKKKGAYILPLKKEIRKKENIQLEDSINFLLEVKVD